MKKSLAGDKETALAFQIADRFISIQETEGSYDYSIMGADYKEIDGGVYDNPDVSIREALNDIGEDTIMNRLVQWKYFQEQKDELHRMMGIGVPKEDILVVFYPETDVDRMREIRKMFYSLKTD